VTGARQLHLNASLMCTGHHEASWRLPESDSFAGTDNLARRFASVDHISGGRTGGTS
jgi:hypothetical protein